jgi:hypothetical protein
MRPNPTITGAEYFRFKPIQADSRITTKASSDYTKRPEVTSAPPRRCRRRKSRLGHRSVTQPIGTLNGQLGSMFRA